MGAMATDLLPAKTTKGWEVHKHREHAGDQGIELAHLKLLTSPEATHACVVRDELSKAAVPSAVGLERLLSKLKAADDTGDEWEGRYIFFWGTIYRSKTKNVTAHRTVPPEVWNRSVDHDHNLAVRYLYKRDGVWRTGYHWLGGSWSPSTFFSATF